MWGKIIIPMYRLWLNGLYGLYGPRCPLFSKRPINLISLSLSHWGRVTHICVSKLTIIGSYNGLSPSQVLQRAVSKLTNFQIWIWHNDTMPMSNTIYMLLINWKMVISLCFKQYLYPVLVVKNVFPIHTTRVAGIINWPSWWKEMECNNNKKSEYTSTMNTKKKHTPSSSDVGCPLWVLLR